MPVGVDTAGLWSSSSSFREQRRGSRASIAMVPQLCLNFFFSGVLLAPIQGQIEVGNIPAKTGALRINLNIDGAPIASKSHTHPSHSQTSRLLTSSLSVGVPVPTQPSVCETCRSLSFSF
jgi:hypothetical protein